MSICDGRAQPPSSLTSAHDIQGPIDVAETFGLPPSERERGPVDRCRRGLGGSRVSGLGDPPQRGIHAVSHDGCTLRGGPLVDECRLAGGMTGARHQLRQRGTRLGSERETCRTNVMQGEVLQLGCGASPLPGGLQGAPGDRVTILASEQRGIRQCARGSLEVVSKDHPRVSCGRKTQF